MSAAEAEGYHSAQISTLSQTSADMVSALTIPCVEEAVGIARASRRFGMPVVISFTVETDGRHLPKVKVGGGCCGTDHRHVAEVCRAWGDLMV